MKLRPKHTSRKRSISRKALASIRVAANRWLGVVAFALAAGLYSNQSQAEIIAIVNPASETMGDGISYEKYVHWGSQPPPTYEALALTKLGDDDTYQFFNHNGAVFLREDSTASVTSQSTSYYVDYASIGYISYDLLHGAEENSNNWVNFSYTKDSQTQYVWAQFDIWVGFISPDRLTCLTYVYSFEQNFSLAEAILAKNTPTHVWHGTNSHWEDGANWMNGVPTVSSIARIAGNGSALISQPGAVANGIELGTSVTNKGELQVGDGGNLTANYLTVDGGKLVIDSRGSAAITDLSLADAEGSSGSIHVEGIASELHVGNVWIGRSGVGDATITSHGLLKTTQDAFVGGGVNSTGKVTVNFGARWEVGGALYVGNLGKGTVVVENVGELEVSGEGVLDGQGTSTAELNMQRDGSAIFHGPLTIGYSGKGLITIGEGSTLTSMGTTILGREAGSQGELTVEGRPMAHASADLKELVVGQNGSGRLNVGEAATVNVTARGSSVYFGREAGSSARVAVSGSHAVLALNVNDISIGLRGSAEVLVQNGGHFEASAAPTYVAERAGAVGTIHVSGADSLFKTSELHLGTGGTGVITIENGAVLEADVHLNSITAGSGTINIGADDQTHPTAAGTIDGNIRFEHQTNREAGRMNFNQTDKTTYAGNISGLGIIRQQGSGTTVLTGDGSGFSGQTGVVQGALFVEGSLGGETVVALNGKLGGSGSLEHVVLGRETALLVGNNDTGVGEMHIGTLEVNVLNVAFNFAGNQVGQYSQLKVDQWLSDTPSVYAINLTLNVESAYLPQLGDTFQLFTGTIINMPVNMTSFGNPLPEGYYWDTTNLTTNGTITVTNHGAVPEPSTWALLGLGVVVAACVLRRTRQRV